MQGQITHRLLSRLFLLGFLVLRAEALAEAGDDHAWIRGVVRVSKFLPGKDARETFQLQVVRGNNDSLTGLAVLTREISKDDPNHAVIVVEGVERDGRFWPYLRGEVANDLEKGWHDVRIARPTGKLAKRRIEPQTLGETIFIDLKTFRPHIGRERYGRLILPNGEVATFLLENLKPSEHAAESWTRGGMGEEELHPSNYEKPFLIPLKEQQRKTFDLVGLEKEAGTLVGRFAYMALNGRSRTLEEQVSDYEEPTWPRAILQVANDYHRQWRKIGETCNPDKPGELKGPPQIAMSLRIYLDAFVPMLGKFRYGRVVLSTGDSAIIELVDLLPPEKDLSAKEPR